MKTNRTKQIIYDAIIEVGAWVLTGGLLLGLLWLGAILTAG